MIPSLVFETAVLPALICIGAVLGIRRLVVRRRARQSVWEGLTPSVGFGLGYLAGHVAAAGPPRVPPVDSTQGLFLAVSIAALAGLPAAGRGRLPAHRWLARGALVGVLLGLTLPAMLRFHWQGREAVLWPLGLAALALLLWLGLDLAAEATPPAAALAGWLTAFAGLGPVFVFSRSGLLAQLAAVAAAALAGLGVAGLLERRGVSVSAAYPVAFVLYLGLVLNAALYAELPLLRALPTALAPAGMALGGVIRNRSRRLLAAVVLSCVGVAALLAPALLLGTMDSLVGPGS